MAVPVDVDELLAQKRGLIARVAGNFIRRHGWIEFDDAFQIVSIEALTILTDPVLCDVDAAITRQGYHRLLDELRSGRVNGVTRSGLACGVRRPSSLNVEISDPDGGTTEALELLPDHERGYGDIDNGDFAARAMSRLPERELFVVFLYFYEGLTQNQIGELLGVTESRINQLVGSAKTRMRAELAA